MIDLRPFQRRFLRAALRPDVDTAALSLPRGNGKSTLAAYLISRILDPDDDLFRKGTESVLCAAGLKQARRSVFRIAKAHLEPKGGYRFADSSNRMGITHVATDTRLEVISSSGKQAMGLVNCPWAVCDEPGAWEVNNGELMHDALQTAQGKPGSPLKVLYIGTVAPGLPGGWWAKMIGRGSHGDVYVQALQANRKRWDSWHEIRHCNPLVEIDEKFRLKLLRERDEARADTRLKARFLSYRLNVPTPDESVVLLTVEDADLVAARPVPDREGRPIFGYDLGAGRAWSAGVALWQNGRCEAVAVAPGIPSIAAQEKRDRVPKGTYQDLADSGRLKVAEGLRVQTAAQLHGACLEAWGKPRGIVCDRFQLGSLKDAVKGVPIAPRVSRWSESTFDISALRKMAKDGPLAIADDCRDLVEVSLSMAMVKPDDAGNVRMVKRGSNNEARDDVAAALVLAAGAWARQPKRSGARYLGKVA